MKTNVKFQNKQLKEKYVYKLSLLDITHTHEFFRKASVHLKRQYCKVNRLVDRRTHAQTEAHTDGPTDTVTS